MVNEDAPDLETLVEDSRNPHAVRQYIAMGDRISALEAKLAEAERTIAEQKRALEWYSVGHCEKHEQRITELEAERDEARRSRMDLSLLLNRAEFSRF